MQDWEEFAARIDSLPEEELLSASADELLKRLDGFSGANSLRARAGSRPCTARSPTTGRRG